MALVWACVVTSFSSVAVAAAPFARCVLYGPFGVTESPSRGHFRERVKKKRPGRAACDLKMPASREKTVHKKFCVIQKGHELRAMDDPGGDIDDPVVAPPMILTPSVTSLLPLRFLQRPLRRMSPLLKRLEFFVVPFV